MRATWRNAASPRGVADTIVVRAEAVEVDQHHADRAARARTARQLEFAPLAPQAVAQHLAGAVALIRLGGGHRLALVLLEARHRGLAALGEQALHQLLRGGRLGRRGVGLVRGREQHRHQWPDRRERHLERRVVLGADHADVGRERWIDLHADGGAERVDVGHPGGLGAHAKRDARRGRGACAHVRGPLGSSRPAIMSSGMSSCAVAPQAEHGRPSGGAVGGSTCSRSSWPQASQ
jgi:hypothetical protein